MPYLVPTDYTFLIQSENLSQVSGASDYNKMRAESAAIVEMRSYLVQKYNMDSAFAETTKWNAALATYAPGNLVYLNPTAYSAAATYLVGAYVLQVGNVYKCSTAIPAPEAFNEAHWTLIGPQYQLYYAAYPHPLFGYQTRYYTGDQVYWNGKIYTAITDSVVYGHDSLLQIGVTNQNGFPINQFPDAVGGSQQWGTGTTYPIPADTDILNATYWTLGDNRNQLLVAKLVDISLYWLHKRIAPRNIPETRIWAYMGAPDELSVTKDGTVFPEYSALGWLQSCMRGSISVELPLIQPRTGNRIRYGSNTKNENSY